MVARAAKEVIADYLYAFKTIEFAVYCPPRDDTNFKVFKWVMGENYAYMDADEVMELQDIKVGGITRAKT